jgi:hypothetical protein
MFFCGGTYLGQYEFATPVSISTPSAAPSRDAGIRQSRGRVFRRSLGETPAETADGYSRRWFSTGILETARQDKMRALHATDGWREHEEMGVGVDSRSRLGHGVRA